MRHISTYLRMLNCPNSHRVHRQPKFKKTLNFEKYKTQFRVQSKPELFLHIFLPGLFLNNN